MARQQARQLRGIEVMGFLFIISQHNKAFIALLIKTAMANEMEDVPGHLTHAHNTLKITPSLAFQPGKLNQAMLFQGANGVRDTPLLLLNVEAGIHVDRVSNHAQNLQRRRNSQWRWGLRHFRIAHQRGMRI